MIKLNDKNEVKMPKEVKKPKTEISTIKRPTIIVLIAFGIIVLLTIPLLLLNAGGQDEHLLSEGTTPTPDTTPAETHTVEILPDLSRIEPEKDPFGSALGISINGIRLSGILSGDDGRVTAIITDGFASYIVGVDDHIGDSEWYLIEISGNTAILTNGEEQITVGFEGRE
jgi:hypothetical protein